MKKYICDMLNVYKEQKKKYDEFNERYGFAFSDDVDQELWELVNLLRGYLEDMFGKCFYEEENMELFLKGEMDIEDIYLYLINK